ncbi:hypothetical protein TeGR_g12716 [Tetraparma gracilis]|uniref:Phosphoribosylformylglycinamidine synthase n=2 Tax=Tetraparma gracilis TaxID=2962635 RepID=A0ABQ6M850_9STRA|nr:hypothetical protein TeGR_g12716 [Tetraparma gracilis]
MEGSSMGVWVAHGEGKFHFPDEDVYKKCTSDNLMSLKYCNDDAVETEQYPFCPNGSRDGIAAMCSDDGRFLAMMPHPERCFLQWQYPYINEELKGKGDDNNAGPWLRMFQNARTFCE